MRTIVVSLLLTSAALAQVPAARVKTEFEVASIRRAPDDSSHDIDVDERRYQTHNINLKELVARAFDVDSRLVYGGPAWMQSQGWDINATIPDELAHASREQLAALMESLLRDRFHLAVHRELRQISGYSLQAPSPVTKMRPSKPEGSNHSMSANKRHLSARNVDMDRLARQLSGNRDIGKLVVDQTGLKNGFDFELSWTPELAEADKDKSDGIGDVPGIFVALQEQLGLKLVAATVPVQAVVVDHAEMPDAN